MSHPAFVVEVAVLSLCHQTSSLENASFDYADIAAAIVDAETFVVAFDLVVDAET